MGIRIHVDIPCSVQIINRMRNLVVLLAALTSWTRAEATSGGELTKALYTLKKLGTLSPSPIKADNVLSGDVFYRENDDRTITIVDFLYPDPGPKTFFAVGKTGSCDLETVGKSAYSLIPGKVGTRGIGQALLPAYFGNENDVVLRLPEGVTVKDLSWICIWCNEYKVNVGSIRLK